jgi:energy-coupling factor transporter ATP-binding protein EcfA2
MGVFACRLCGRLNDGKRFCTYCRTMNFELERTEVLAYSGPVIGSFKDGMPFIFPVNLLSTHVVISGQTGTGKSRLAMLLAKEVENQSSNQKLLVIDIEGEWSGLDPMLKGKTEYYDVASNLRINPFDLDDPGLIRELFRETVFKGIEKEYVDLSAQMNFVLQDAISESRNMEELIHNIRFYNKQKLTGLDKTKTALLVRLDPFTRSPLKEIFFCKHSNPELNQLGENNTILSLHALERLVCYSSELRLIYNTLTTYFLRKMLDRDPISQVSNLFVADEAQLLVPRILQKVIVTESWPATEFATRLRKRGCGLVLITQSPSNLEHDIIKNSATKITFRLQDEQDIKLIANAAGFMDRTEFQYMADKFVKLPNRNAIVCIAGCEPFLITASEFSTPQNAIVAPVNQSMDILEKPSPEITQFETDEKAFLESIRTHPFAATTKRRSLLGWDGRRYSKILKGLLDRKVVQEMAVKVGRGSPKLLHQLFGSVPSVRHEFYIDIICKALEKAGLDFQKNKVGPDIIVPRIDTAIEVELGKSDMIGNMENNLQKFDRVIVCSDDQKVLKSLAAIAKSERVSFLRIQDCIASIEKFQTNRVSSDFG